MRTSPRVRPAQIEDLSLIVALARSAPTGAQWPAAQFERAIAPEKGSSPSGYRVTVFEKGSQLCGFLIGRILAPECEIENIVVEEAGRRQGMGGALIAEFLQYATESGCDKALLEVRESNAAARALYESSGFRESGRRKQYYRDPSEDAVLYERVL